MVLWSYNLFIFLLLRVLPIYFDKIKTPPVDMAYTVVPIPKQKQETRQRGLRANLDQRWSREQIQEGWNTN